MATIWAGLNRLAKDETKLVLLLLAFYGVLAILRGPIAHEDAHSYLNWGNALIERHYDFAAFLREIEWQGGDLRFYLAWIALVASSITIFGAGWKSAIVTMNVAWFVLGGWLILRHTKRIDQTGTSSIVVFAFLVGLWDYYYWMSHVLADSSVVLIALVVMFLVTRAYVPSTGSAPAKDWVLAGAIAVASVIFKPQGLAIFGFVAAAAAAHPFLRSNNAADLAGRLRWVFVVGLILCAAAVYTFAVGVFDPSVISNDWLRYMVTSQMSDYGRDGSIIWQRYETYVAPPKTPFDYVGIVALRFVYMFSPYARDYSFGHKIVNMIGLVPLYVLAVAGLWAVFSGRAKVEMQKFGALAAMLIVGCTMLHAITALDYDWRYRAPLFPPLLVLATIGWNTFMAARKDPLPA